MKIKTLLICLLFTVTCKTTFSQSKPRLFVVEMDEGGQFRTNPYTINKVDKIAEIKGDTLIIYSDFDEVCRQLLKYPKHPAFKFIKMPKLTITSGHELQNWYNGGIQLLTQ